MVVILTSIVLMVVGIPGNGFVLEKSCKTRLRDFCHPAVEGNWPLIFLWLMGEETSHY